MTAAGVSRPPLDLATKLSYGVGSVAYGAKLHIFGLLLFFYNQLQGLPAHWVSAALAFALVIDALWDPTLGQLSDRIGKHGHDVSISTAHRELERDQALLRPQLSEHSIARRRIHVQRGNRRRERFLNRIESQQGSEGLVAGQIAPSGVLTKLALTDCSNSSRASANNRRFSTESATRCAKSCAHSTSSSSYAPGVRLTSVNAPTVC